MFENCTGLTTVNIGNGVKVIERNAFKGCSSLVTVTIPDSVEQMDAGAFAGCTTLRAVKIGTDGWYYTPDQSRYTGTDVDLSNSSIAARTLSGLTSANYFKRIH
jgi:hypothetical protein